MSCTRLRLLGLVCLLAGSSWLGAAPSATTEQRPALQAGTPEGLPGYGLTAAGGLLIESEAKRRVFECIESQMGVRFRWKALPTRRLLQELGEGRLDLGFPLGFTPERSRTLHESAPAWDNPDVWLSRRPVDIKDKRLRLAARLGSPQHAEYTADGYDKIVGFYSYGDLIKALALDLADAVVVPQSVYLDQQALWPADIVVTPGRSRRSGFYLPPRDPKRLAAPLDRAIERCRTASLNARAPAGR